MGLGVSFLGGGGGVVVMHGIQNKVIICVLANIKPFVSWVGMMTAKMVSISNAERRIFAPTFVRLYLVEPFIS